MAKPVSPTADLSSLDIKMSAEDRAVIERIAAEAGRLTGNQLSGDAKLHMVASRLKKRMQEVGVADYKAYEKFFYGNRAIESDALISLLTTHHTYFFREFSHFEHLLDRLPQLVASAKAKGDTELRLWSAACSKG